MRGFNLSPDWMLNIPSFDEYIIHHRETLKSQSEIKKYTEKWLSLIQHQFDGYNIDKDLISNLCIYMELCSNYYTMLESVYGMKGQIERLPEIIIKIKADLKFQMQNRRSAVVRKVFNYQTGKMEYELEDGNFVGIDEKVISPKVTISDEGIFPKEFIKIINPEKYRDMKIDEIL